MPTYEYVCRSCKHEFEIFQPINSAPKRTCPKCRRSTAKRKIGSGAGIIFRGSGFYETDYRSDDYRKRAKAEQESQSKSSETAAKDGTKDSSGDKGAEKSRESDGTSPAATPARTKPQKKRAKKAD